MLGSILRSRRAPVAALLALLSLAPSAEAQVGRAYPGQMYFTALEELYDADYPRAEDFFRREFRHAVREGNARWVDSICHATMLGEALYQQGRFDQAIDRFDAAVDLFLSNANWLSRVNFQQPLREDVSIARRLPAWARPNRRVVYADVPRTFLYQVGQLDNSAVAQSGGVVRQAQYWKLNAEEVAWTTAWALYRRGQLLGPLGAYDKRTETAANRFAGGVGNPSHWSSAWVDLWTGLAKASAGDALGAKPYLDRAMLLGGKLDHRLTGLALLAQGRLTAGQDAAAAATLFAEAIASAIAYDQPDLAAEASQALHELSILTGSVPGPPLTGLSDWAQRRGNRHLVLQSQLAGVELAITRGENLDSAAPTALFGRDRDAAAGLLGREAERLGALIAATDEKQKDPLAVARNAVAGQTAMSRRLLQLRLALAWSAEGRLPAHRGRKAFGELLSDPTPFAWQTTPLDAVASSAAPAVAAFDTWFAMAVDRRDALLALRVIDLQRRREFFASQPLGGRLTAIRWLLEAPDDALPDFAVEPRAALERSIPAYREEQLETKQAVEALSEQLAGDPDQLGGGGMRLVERLKRSLDRRERLVLRAAMTRAVTPLVFPPPIDPALAKQSLAPGETLIAFHVWGDDLYGVWLTGTGERLWRIDTAKRVGQQVDELVEALAGARPDTTWSGEQLSSAAWTQAADALAKTLLTGSDLDPNQLARVRVCPDGPLWRAPLGLILSPGDRYSPATVPAVTHAPTPGWAARPRGELRAAARTWLSAMENPDDEPPWGDDPLARVASATPMVEGLEAVPLLKSFAERVVIDTTGVRLAADATQMMMTKGPKGQQTLRSWVRLPRRGPEVAAVVGLGSAPPARSRSRAGAPPPPPGDPEFQILASLLAGGVETALIEKWPTGGARSRELVAEWLVGVGRLSPLDAWKRSVMLGRSERLDPEREPRLALQPGETPRAEHPFWWAGYVLVD